MKSVITVPGPISVNGGRRHNLHITFLPRTIYVIIARNSLLGAIMLHEGGVVTPTKKPQQGILECLLKYFKF